MVGRRVLLLLLLVSACCASCRREPQPPAVVRLIDQLDPALRNQIADVDGLIMPTLPVWKSEYRFPLGAVPAKPMLTFAVGTRQWPEPTRVHFEVLLAPAAGEPVRLYERDLGPLPSWSDAHIDLSDRDLAGASLIFRRALLQGPKGALRGIWGNPILVAGTPRPRPSVILISLDTLRADFVGAYGRTSARTFALDGLARDGALFEAAASPSTWTVPSHASLFYSAHLPDTPVRLRAAKAVWPDTPLPEQPLAAILRKAGYLTAGFTGGGYLDWIYDFPRGFDIYFAYEAPAIAQCMPARFDGSTVFAGATNWLRANHQHPFFLFIHTYDVHDRCPFMPGGGRPMFGVVPELTPERLQKLLRYYDGLISETDQRVADLLATVDQLGLRDSTVVVVLSDHGEAFFEHGDFGHGCNMKPYEELTQVPLLIRYPPEIPAGTRVTTPVSLNDVVPTILELLDVAPAPHMTGQVLPGLGLAGAPRDAAPIYVGCGDALAVRRDRFKLITSQAARYPDELYDLAADPLEERRISNDAPIRSELRADAARFWAQALSATPIATLATARGKPGTPVATPTALDASTTERLRALGYLH